ncbi:nucleotidyltransferase family protein [Marinobacter sp. OP 3.4]|uniref:nucleotidyltransferase family protein n=1 Tax=Marinobacter sp. OP 3.4 TaxID=3076501 RepID=UPI002E1E42F6
MASAESPATGHSTGLPDNVLQDLQRIFANHPVVERVVLYGSRAKGNFRPNSGIDLMVIAPKISWREFNQMETEIDDLLLPWKVDLALEHQVENDELLAHVRRVGIPLDDR